MFIFHKCVFVASGATAGSCAGPRCRVSSVRQSCQHQGRLLCPTGTQRNNYWHSRRSVQTDFSRLNRFFQTVYTSSFMHKKDYTFTMLTLKSFCVSVPSGPWGRSSLWSSVWWRICWRSQYQVKLELNYSEIISGCFRHSDIFRYKPEPETSNFPDWFLTSHVLCCVLRCTSPRGYRLPPCALINLSHGARVDPASHKLTAVVKPQPAAAANFNSQRQLGGLNHSPRSPFIPTQVREMTRLYLFSYQWLTVLPSFTFTVNLLLSPLCICSITTNRAKRPPRATGTLRLRVSSRSSRERLVLTHPRDSSHNNKPFE